MKLFSAIILIDEQRLRVDEPGYHHSADLFLFPAEDIEEARAALPALAAHPRYVENGYDVKFYDLHEVDATLAYHRPGQDWPAEGDEA